MTNSSNRVRANMHEVGSNWRKIVQDSAEIHVDGALETCSLYGRDIEGYMVEAAGDVRFTKAQGRKPTDNLNYMCRMTYAGDSDMSENTQWCMITFSTRTSCSVAPREASPAILMSDCWMTYSIESHRTTSTNPLRGFD